MKKNLMIMSLLLCGVFAVTGCENKSNNNDYGVNLDADNVLVCTSMKYNIFGNYSSEILENHMFFAEYDESKTNISNVTEIYTADYSKSEKELTKEDLDQLK